MADHCALEAVVDNPSVREMDGTSRMDEPFTVDTAGTPKNIVSARSPVAATGRPNWPKVCRNFGLQLPHLGGQPTDRHRGR